jgi:hypothetical protein
LLCSPELRLGGGTGNACGPEQLLSHQFFQGLDWHNIRQLKPPFVPMLENECDLTYFKETARTTATEDASGQAGRDATADEDDDDLLKLTHAAASPTPASFPQNVFSNMYGATNTSNNSASEPKNNYQLDKVQNFTFRMPKHHRQKSVDQM